MSCVFWPEVRFREVTFSQKVRWFSHLRERRLWTATCACQKCPSCQRLTASLTTGARQDNVIYTHVFYIERAVDHHTDNERLREAFRPRRPGPSQRVFGMRTSGCWPAPFVIFLHSTPGMVARRHRRRPRSYRREPSPLPLKTRGS